MTEVRVSITDSDGDERITVNLPKLLVDRCQRAADAADQSLGEWVSDAMINYDRSGLDLSECESLDAAYRATIMDALTQHADRQAAPEQVTSYRVDEVLE